MSKSREACGARERGLAVPAQACGPRFPSLPGQARGPRPPSSPGRIRDPIPIESDHMGTQLTCGPSMALVMILKCRSNPRPDPDF